MRLFAFVPEGSDKGKVAHRLGMPMNDSLSQLMPATAMVILDQTDEGFFLVRYSANGEFAGDTWHESVEDAKEQAEFEFGNLRWKQGEEGTKDAEFARAKLAERELS